MTEYLTCAAMLKRLNVSRAAFYAHVRPKALEAGAVIYIGRTPRFDFDACLALLKAKARSSEAREVAPVSGALSSKEIGSSLRPLKAIQLSPALPPGMSAASVRRWERMAGRG